MPIRRRKRQLLLPLNRGSVRSILAIIATSWKQASSYFQGAVTEKNWTDALNGTRKPLGKLLSRKIVKTQSATSLPGAPDGNYLVMQFDTSFANKKSAVETVTFMREKDGSWRAAGYYIK